MLGPRGPWIVERIIGMREFPHSMDVDGKVSMLEASVRALIRIHATLGDLPFFNDS